MSKGVFPTCKGIPYHFLQHTNELVMDRSEAEASEVFVTVIKPGKATHLHRHDDTEQIYFVLEGKGIIGRGKGGQVRQTILPGDVVHIPRNSWHKVGCLGKKTLKYLVVDVFPKGRPSHEPTWHSHAKVVARLMGAPLKKKARGYSLV